MRLSVTKFKHAALVEALLVEGRKGAVSPFLAYRKPARSGEPVKDGDQEPPRKRRAASFTGSCAKGGGEGQGMGQAAGSGWG